MKNKIKFILKIVLQISKQNCKRLFYLCCTDSIVLFAYIAMICMVSMVIYG